VTVAVTVQLPLDGIEAPERLMVPDPAFAVAVPPLQFEVKPLGLATTSPDGSGSAKATPVSAAKLFGFVMTKLTVVVPPGRNLPGEKVLVILGGAITRIEAVAWFPDPAVELTLLVALFCTPGLIPVTVTLKLHDEVAANVAPERVMLAERTVIVPPPHEPTKPDAVNPDGSGSENPMPPVATVFGFMIVKLRLVFPPIGIEAAPKFLLMDGGTTTVPARLFTISLLTTSPDEMVHELFPLVQGVSSVSTITVPVAFRGGPVGSKLIFTLKVFDAWSVAQVGGRLVTLKAASEPAPSRMYRILASPVPTALLFVIFRFIAFTDPASTTPKFTALGMFNESAGGFKRLAQPLTALLHIR
jgi:hypothetical protein